MSKLRGEGTSPPFFYSPPKSFPEGLFVTMLVLGHRSLEESYPSLANWSGSGPSRVNSIGQGQCPCQGDKLCLLNGLWSQGLSLSLSHGGLQLLKPGRALPNISPLFLCEINCSCEACETSICCFRMQSRENNLHIHCKAQIRIKTRRRPTAARTQTHKFSPSNQFFWFSYCRLSWRVWNTFCSVQLLMSLSCGGAHAGADRLVR